MATKKQPIVILFVSLVIAVAILCFGRNMHNKSRFSSRVFQLQNGWGYDILVDDSLIIRQESVPSLSTNMPFEKKVQAEKTAALVINKMKAGKAATVTRFEIEQICNMNTQR